jgi:peptidoglycan-N-acetylglucosamine deacetylase
MISSFMRAGAALAIAGFCLGGEARASEVCWTPSELQHRLGEEKVVQGTKSALAEPPAIAPGDLHASPYAWRGALRRVDLPPGKKVIALTFDLCEQPHEVAGYQGELVDYLREHNVRATFFAGGKWMLTHAGRAQQLVADPLFEVANHTWEHRNLRLLSGSMLDDEIGAAQLAYRKMRLDLAAKQCLDRTKTRLAHERAPDHMTLFRFPFGACDQRSMEAVQAAGLRAIQWDVSSSDPWVGETSEKMIHDVVSRVRPGSIVLFHANGRGWHTSKAIPMIVEALQAQGYHFATVTELLSVPGARPVTSELCYDAKPGDTDKYDALARRLADRHAAIVARLRGSAAAGGPDTEESRREK